MLIPIDAVDDPRLDVYRNLPHAQSRRRSPQFVVEGALLVERLAASDLTLTSIAVEAGRRSLLPPVDHQTPVYELAPAAIRSLVGYDFHRGILAAAERPADVARTERHPTWLGVALDRIDDPQNLGAILRTCAAFGVDEVVVGRGSVDPWSRRVARVSMGALFQLHVRDEVDLEKELEHWHEQQVETIATVLDSTATRLIPGRGRAPQCWLFGREDTGLDSALIEQCSERVMIPIRADVDSLNVAAAAAIALFAARAADST